MRSSTVFTGLAALAAATLATATPCTPSKPSEEVSISDFTVRKDESGDATTIQSVYFVLSGADADGLTCSASDPALPSDVVTCGDTKYRFSLQPGTDDDHEFSLRIYHELGIG